MKLTSESYKKTIQTCQHLSPIEKTECTAGWNKLVDVLSEEWLSSLSKDHPLFLWSMNHTSWAIKSLSDFGNKLNKLKYLNRFKTLLNGLKGSKFNETVAEIIIFSRLQENGFEIELYPILDSRKKADVRGTKDGKEFWWEVTTISESGYEKIAQKTGLSLFRPPDGDIHVRFKAHRTLSDPEIEKFNQLIKEKILIVKTGAGFAHIHKEGALDYYIATDDQFDQIPQEFQGHLSVVSEPVDYKKRILDKITYELPQLPEDQFGIVAIFILSSEIQDFQEEFINEIRAVIEPYSKVCAVFISTFYFDPTQEINTDTEYFKVIQGYRYNTITERTFMIKINPQAEHLAEIFK